MEDFRTQWQKVDMDFLKKLIALHNQITFNKQPESEFDKFVLDNKDKLNNPDYLQVFSERIELTKEYIGDHLEMCEFFYDFMRNNPDWQKLDFDFRSSIRLSMFEDLFAEFIDSK